MEDSFINNLVDKLIKSTKSGECVWINKSLNVFEFLMPFDAGDDDNIKLSLMCGIMLHPANNLPTTFFQLGKLNTTHKPMPGQQNTPEIIVRIFGLSDNIGIYTKISDLFQCIHIKNTDKNVRGIDKKFVMTHINSLKASKE